MRINTRKFFVWLPAAILASLMVIVLLLAESSNHSKIRRLERQLNSSSTALTFLFTQNGVTVRVVCLDSTKTSIYTCTTIQIPSPTPAPKRR